MVSPGDFGLYSCHASNKLGGAAAETLIAVEVEYVTFLFFCLGLFILNKLTYDDPHSLKSPCG